MAEKLSRLPGVVYQLDEQRTEEIPPEGDEQAHTLYVIHMFRRSPSRKETTLRYYYCLDGIIYEAPTLGAVPPRCALVAEVRHVGKGKRLPGGIGEAVPSWLK